MNFLINSLENPSNMGGFLAGLFSMKSFGNKLAKKKFCTLRRLIAGHLSELSVYEFS